MSDNDIAASSPTAQAPRRLETAALRVLNYLTVVPTAFRESPEFRREALKFVPMALAALVVLCHPHTATMAPALRWPLVGVETLAGVFFLATWFFMTSSLTKLATRVAWRRALFGLGSLLNWGAISAVKTNPLYVAILVSLAVVVGAFALLVIVLVGGTYVANWAKTRPVLPPGSRARGWLGFIYGRKTMERVFDPMLGDIQAEWLAHEVAGRRWYAHMTRLRGYVELGQAVALNGGEGLLKMVVHIWKITK